MDKFGLGYEDLRKIKQDIIMLRASAQGQTGSKSSHKALGLQLSALAGIPHFTGFPEREPLSLMFAYPDYVIPFPVLAALGAALDYKMRTGKGQLLDFSQFEVILQFMSPYLMDYTVNNHISMRDGNRHPYAAPHGVYPCKGDDAWCAITVFNDTEWNSLCSTMGNPEWADEFKTSSARKNNEERLNKHIRDWTINYSAKDLMQLLQSHGVTSGVVQKGEDIYCDPQLKHRNFLWKLNHAEMGEFTHLGQPAVMSRTPAKAKWPSPRLGEHSELVCREFLGMSEEEFIRLLTTGAIGMLL
jgi:crotonobetainyl-CoA:carnitine CoA-transferase CaiB-like acyl-CoA transferase